MGNMKDDIERLAQVWDKALAKGIFDDVSPKKSPSGDREMNFFGQMPTVYDTEIKDSDMAQWSDMLNTHSISEDRDVVITEESAPSKGKVKKHSKKMANTNNPVYPDSRGVDTKVPDPNNDFAGGDNLRKLSDLKKKLHGLKVDLTRTEILEKMGGKNADAKVAKIEKSIDRLSSEIDELSDMLNGSIIDNK